MWKDQTVNGHPYSGTPYPCLCQMGLLPGSEGGVRRKAKAREVRHGNRYGQLRLINLNPSPGELRTSIHRYGQCTHCTDHEVPNGAVEYGSVIVAIVTVLHEVLTCQWYLQIMYVERRMSVWRGAMSARRREEQ